MQQDIIKQVQDAGFKVWMRKPEDTWLIYGDDKDNIAYLQADRHGYATISTIHAPVQGCGCGSGFGLDDIPRLDRENLSRGFILAPHWASSQDVRCVRKWNGIDEYRKSSAFNADYKLVD